MQEQMVWHLVNNIYRAHPEKKDLLFQPIISFRTFSL